VNEVNSRRRLRLDPHGADEPLPWRSVDLGLTSAITWPSHVSKKLMRGLHLGLDLAALAHRRWRIAVTTPYLCHVGDLFRQSATPLETATALTLMAFQGLPLRARTEDGDIATDGSLNVRRALMAWTSRRNEFADNVLAHERNQARVTGAKRSFYRAHSMLAGLEVYLRGPDPLDLLSRDVLHLPTTVNTR
jgi:hypothetical protein